MLKMLARSCLRSTRLVGAVRNGAVNTTKVRLLDLNSKFKIGGRQTGIYRGDGRPGVMVLGWSVALELMADN